MSLQDEKDYKEIFDAQQNKIPVKDIVNAGIAILSIIRMGIEVYEEYKRP